MPSAQQDTEITLGTGRMLAIFFTFVSVCAVFFAIGFSLGRKTLAPPINAAAASNGTSATTTRPPTEKTTTQSKEKEQDSNFGFYKAVGEKGADTALTPSATSKTPPAPVTASAPVSEPAPKGVAGAPTSIATGVTYYVQVAAVTRQEDAQSLVDALKKKQYPAFSANNPSVDRFYRVQVGPYGDLKEAEATRARLVGDGYNPIVKK